MRYLLFLVFALTGIGSHAQSSSFEILFYNTENLFDTLDNSQTIDEDFTPAGKLKYTRERFELKTQNLADVINASIEEGMPEIIGLCEVENEMVVEELKSKLNYAKSYKHYLSGTRDKRGIQNALLIHKRFKKLKIETHEIDLKDERPTRPVFSVLLEDSESKAQFWVLVNHWPSRYGGTQKSNWKRVAAASVVSNLITDYKSNYPEAGIIVMGDLNDYPSNESVMSLEKCKSETDPCMVNLLKHFDKTKNGTHAYKGEWNVLDQILVSKDLLNDGSLSVSTNSGKIVKHDWMLYESKKYDDMLPSRTYAGPSYYGGYSDHLPVFIKVDVN